MKVVGHDTNLPDLNHGIVAADFRYLFNNDGIAQLAADHLGASLREEWERRIARQMPEERLPPPGHEGDHIGGGGFVIVP